MRYKFFLNLIHSDYTDGCDDHIVLKEYSKGLTSNEKFLICLYYGLTYSVTSTVKVFENRDKVTEDWWYTNKNNLYFDEDNMRIKTSNAFTKTFNQFKQAQLKKHNTFQELYTYLTSFYNIGAFRSFLILDCIIDLLPEYYIEPKKMPWNSIDTNVKDGLYELYNYPKPKKQYNTQFLDKAFDKLYYDSKGYPKIKLESLLCVFHKYLKGTRYIGFYADRQLEEIHNYSHDIKFWYSLRKKTIPAKYRSELQGIKGIQKNKLKKLNL